MAHQVQQLLMALLSAAIFLPRLTAGQDFVGPGFDTCKDRIDKILNGTESWRGITNETISQYLYTGPVRGMKPKYERSSRVNFVTVTTNGCKVLCEDPIDWYWTKDIGSTLAIISNWILPIMALLAALPYDSLHPKHIGEPWYRSRFPRTAGALLNWLGSPQTALTATLFNIDQMRKCYYATVSSGHGIAGHDNLQSLKRDTYYVLSCVGQFSLSRNDEDRFVTALLYGLFRPFVTLDNGESDNGAAVGNAIPLQSISQQVDQQEKATKWTSELLQEMAFQLRMLRRRGVYPAFISVFLFFVAYGVAIALALANIGERTTAHALALGILLSWLPLLVLFTILDRNPTSADRSRKLIARWLWNADAVRQWEELHTTRDPHAPIMPTWWSQEREDLDRAKNSESQVSGNTPPRLRFDGCISQFAGQGRQIGYNGLTYSVLVNVYSGFGDNRRMRSIQEMINPIVKDLQGGRPWTWWALSLVSLLLVWLDIGMALMLSYNTPTVGLGCRSTSYIVYGLFSTLTWILHLLPCFKHPKVVRKVFCHIICICSTLTLGFIIFASFSGIFNNCLCKGGLSGYLDFENAQFYRNQDHFDVKKWWAASAFVVAVAMFAIFIAASVLLRILKPLWQASEQKSLPVIRPEADMDWLM